ncbi:MAG: SPOR domain-containing protein, partial [Bacteroidota bacterium]
RLTQPTGAFDDLLPGETPQKPEPKPAPEEEEGEDVAGLHGTRHVQDSLQEVDEQEHLSRLTLHNDDPKAAHIGEAPHAERHEFVRRGGHQSELSAGDFVIVGVFKTEVNAKRWADGLKAMGFKDIDYGFLTERTVWYVHFAGIDDLTEARSVRDQYRKLKVFRDAWLLTVQE